jgi:hypothetical protein
LAVVLIAATGAAANYALSAGQGNAFNERWQQMAQAVPPSPKPAPAKPAVTPQQNLPVSLEQALYLIRSTMLTLNDANRAGNYSVLHDLAAPSFQAKNNPADLARIFTNQREHHTDLFQVALVAPQLSSPPRLETNGMLRLTGIFPTRPLQINFDLMFENVGGQWRLFGISVQTPEVAPQANLPAAPKR